MAKQDDIQSTEKLLELIRHQDPIEPSSTQASRPDAPAKPGRRSLPGKVRIRKNIVIGVDVGHTYIRLAKIQHSADKSFVLLDYRDVPLNQTFALSDPKILQKLKSHVQQFCGKDTNARFWSAITSARVETRCIHIPKLPGKQVHNAVFWTFTKKVPLDQAEEVLDYEILGDVSEGGVKKTEVVAYKAPREEIRNLRGAFQSIGYPLDGITIVPFAIQNLFRTQILPYDGEDICSLFVGRDWSRIAIYSQGNLILSRGIKAGMRSMIEAMNLYMNRSDQWSETSPDTPNDTRPSERATAIDPAVQKLFFDFITASERSPDPSTPLGRYNIGQVYQMLLPAMERLIRQIERTFEHYTLNFHREGVRRIFISGAITASRLVVDHIGKQLDLPITVMDPFESDPDFAEQVNIPKGPADRESYVPAIGLGLSSNRRTPNFLFTHQDRDREERIRRNNMHVLTACLIFLVVLIGIFSWQERRLDAKRADVARLNAQLLAYNPPAEKDHLMALYAKTKGKRETVKRIAQRFLPVAVVNELAGLTPSHIRLLNLDTTYIQRPQTPEDPMGTLVMEGIIFGETNTLETSLTSYLYSLRNSQLFSHPNILNKREAFFNGQQVLRFNIKVNIM